MRLARSILWNAAGIGLPLAVGVVVVPAIVRGLGTERFGFLSIVWMMIGYFSIFDLGLGRTLTKLVADRLGQEREREIGPLVSTTLIIVIVSGVLVSVATALSAGWLAQRTMGASPALVPEATFRDPVARRQPAVRPGRHRADRAPGRISALRPAQHGAAASWRSRSDRAARDPSLQ